MTAGEYEKLGGLALNRRILRANNETFIAAETETTRGEKVRSTFSIFALVILSYVSRVEAQEFYYIPPTNFATGQTAPWRYDSGYYYRQAYPNSGYIREPLYDSPYYSGPSRRPSYRVTPITEPSRRRYR